MHVFCDVVFAWILEGFWDGFGKPKSLIFALFGNFFDTNRYKIEVKKNNKKSEESRARPLAPRSPTP